MAEASLAGSVARISVHMVLGLLVEVRNIGKKTKRSNKHIDMLVLRSQSCIEPLETLNARGVNKENEVALQYLKYVLEKMIKFLKKVEARGILNSMVANDENKINWLNEHLSHASLGLCVNKAIMGIPQASSGIHATNLFSNIPGQSDPGDGPISPGRAGSNTDGMAEIAIDFKSLSDVDTGVIIGSGNGSNGSVVKTVEYKGQMVALKKYTRPKLSSKHKQKKDEIVSVEKLFVREALIMHALDHPNIITFIGADLPEFIMIMELAQCSLYDVLHIEETRAMFDFSLVADDSMCRADVIQVLTSKLSILNDIAGAISYLHLLEFIHRDIKSMNVLLCGSGGSVVAKLADFGASKDVRGDVPGLCGADTTLSNGLNGTIAYLAPEQIDGDRPKATFAVDVFAFGVLCNEVMTNSVPWDSCNDIFQIITKVKQNCRSAKAKPPFHPSSDATTDAIYGDMNQLIGDARLGMLSNDANARYSSHRVSAILSEFLNRCNAVGFVNDELSQLQAVVARLTNEKEASLLENAELKKQLEESERDSSPCHTSSTLENFRLQCAKEKERAIEEAEKKWSRQEEDYKRRLAASLRSKRDLEEKAGHITDKLKEDVAKYKSITIDAQALLKVENKKMAQLTLQAQVNEGVWKDQDTGYKRRMAEAAEKVSRLTDASLKAVNDNNVMKARLEGSIANLQSKNARLESDIVKLQENLLKPRSK